MTRETKIGLLVGLAFIIVIGILLSDYNRNESQAAALNAVAADVAKGSATPHNGSNENAILPPTPRPVPTRPVPTHDEVHPPRPAPRPAAPPAGPVAAAPAPPHHGAVAVPPSIGELLNSGELVAVDDPHPAPPAPAPPAPKPPVPAPPAGNTGNTVNGAKQYVAVSGDTVSRLAGRFLGANTKSNREAIIALNASLKENPNNITVGKTYMIPPKATAAAPAPAVAAAAATPAVSHNYYVVKENDSLWKIAAEQVGDTSAIETLKELNKDVLKGGDVLHPNMRLRLPGKRVASVN